MRLRWVGAVSVLLVVFVGAYFVNRDSAIEPDDFEIEVERLQTMWSQRSYKFVAGLKGVRALLNHAVRADEITLVKGVHRKVFPITAAHDDKVSIRPELFVSGDTISSSTWEVTGGYQVIPFFRASELEPSLALISLSLNSRGLRLLKEPVLNDLEVASLRKAICDPKVVITRFMDRDVFLGHGPKGERLVSMRVPWEPPFIDMGPQQLHEWDREHYVNEGPRMAKFLETKIMRNVEVKLAIPVTVRSLASKGDHWNGQTKAWAISGDEIVGKFSLHSGGPLADPELVNTQISASLGGRWKEFMRADLTRFTGKEVYGLNPPFGVNGTWDMENPTFYMSYGNEYEAGAWLDSHSTPGEVSTSPKAPLE